MLGERLGSSIFSILPNFLRNVAVLNFIVVAGSTPEVETILKVHDLHKYAL